MDIASIKSIFKLLSDPLALAFVFLFVGLAVAYFSERTRACKFIVGVGTVWLLLSSQYFFSNLLLAPLEHKHKTVHHTGKEWRDVDAIVVLGCFYYEDSELPLASNWASCSMNRMIQAVAMYHQIHTNIVVTGGYFLKDPNVSYAEVAKQFLVDMGVQPQDIIVVSAGKNTQQEFSAMSKMKVANSLAIVTSATHISRSVKLAQAHGFEHIVPIPVDHLSPTVNPFTVNLPSSVSIQNTHRAIYEYLALLYQWFTEN